MRFFFFFVQFSSFNLSFNNSSRKYLPFIFVVVVALRSTIELLRKIKKISKTTKKYIYNDRSLDKKWKWERVSERKWRTQNNKRVKERNCYATTFFLSLFYAKLYLFVLILNIDRFFFSCFVVLVVFWCCCWNDSETIIQFLRSSVVVLVVVDLFLWFFVVVETHNKLIDPISLD